MYKLKDIFTLNLNSRGGGVKLFNKIANKYNLHKEDRKDLMNVEVGSSEDRKYYILYDDFYNTISHDNMLKGFIFGSCEYMLMSYYGNDTIHPSSYTVLSNNYANVVEVSFIKFKTYDDNSNPQTKTITSLDDMIDGMIGQGLISSDIKNYYKEISKEESRIYQLIGE